jgi:hypothetical protein
MGISRNSCLAALAALLAAAPAAQAHHSYAMFNMDKSVDLKGEIVQFKWSNPHAWIVVDATDAAGQKVRWNVEMNSPNNLALLGWKRSTLKPGDKVVMTVHPLKDGKQGGSFMSVQLPDGKSFKG